MVFACEKLISYILGSHVIVHTDHVAIKYLMAKKEALVDQMGAVAARI